jgi:hypothetical protein
MSIVLRILALEAPSGPLRRFTPRFRGNESERRKLSIEAGIYDWLHDETGTDAMQEMRAQARANCSAFVRGLDVDDCDFIKRVEDRRLNPSTFDAGVWALSIRFDPQHRLFGFFAITDWFVVLSSQDRGVLAEGDHRWHAEIDRCQKRWNELFPAHQPWVRPNLSEYLSSNVEKCDDRW